MTLEQLAKEIDSSKGYVWELERRKTKMPSGEKLQKIADVFNVTPDFLLNEKRMDTADDITREAFFRKLNNLEKDDQDKILNIINTWPTKK